MIYFIFNNNKKRNLDRNNSLFIKSVSRYKTVN